MSAFDPAAFLPDDLLERIRERAPIHDRENTFPQQDLDELRAAGYLAILVPADRGGAGLGLAEAAIWTPGFSGTASSGFSLRTTLVLSPFCGPVAYFPSRFRCCTIPRLSVVRMRTLGASDAD